MAIIHDGRDLRIELDKDEKYLVENNVIIVTKINNKTKNDNNKKEVVKKDES